MNMIQIDGDKLRNEFIRRNVTLGDAGLQMGYSRDYLSHVARRGTIQAPSLNALEHNFHIKYEDIKPDEKPQEAEPSNTVEESSFDWEKLREVIKAAVVEALNA